MIEIARFVKDAASLPPSVFVVSCFYYACIPAALQTHTLIGMLVYMSIFCMTQSVRMLNGKSLTGFRLKPLGVELF